MNKIIKSVFCLAATILLASTAQAAFYVVSKNTSYNSFLDACNNAANTDTIRLTSDMNLGSNAITLSKNITLTSAGGNVYTLTRNNSNGRITVPQHNTLTLSNIDINVNNVSSSACLFTVEGTLVIDSGTTIRNAAGATGIDGGAIVVDGGTLTMNDGTIRDCKSGGGRSAGAIFIKSGTMTMNGGTIRDNTAEKNGGGVVVGEAYTSNVGRFYMRGGTITGNTCSNDRWGGGVCILNASSYVYFSGSPVVTGNKRGTVANDVDYYQNNGTTANTDHLVQDGNLTADARIGVRYPASNYSGARFGTAVSGVTGSKAFFYDEDDSQIGWIQSNTQLVWKGAPVCRIGSTDYSSLADAVTAARNGNTIILLADIQLGADQAIGKNVTIMSDAGHTYKITRTNEGSEFTISGSVTLSNVVFDGNALTGSDALFVVSSSGTLTINDGTTIRNCKRGSDGSAIRVNGGTVTMNGGSITGNSAISGGAILIGSGTMTVNGGTISGNTASNEGGAIAVGTWNSTSDAATLNLRGGTITGNTCGSGQRGGGAVSIQNSVSYVRVSGSPVVEGNTKGTATNDISFYNADWMSHLVQDGNLEPGAHLGVAFPASGTAEGLQFGTASTGVTGSNAFFYDGGNSTVGTADSIGILYWAPADPVCRLVSNGRTYSTLEGAYADATATDEIQLLKNLTLSYAAALPIGKNITLSSDPGHTYTLTRGNGGCAISVPNGKALTLENIVIDGANLDASSAMFVVDGGGTLNVNAGATIQNCKNIATKGGAVYLGVSAITATSTTNAYQYYKFVFKKSGNGDFQISELKLFDANGNRINGGTYTTAARNADPSTLNQRQCVFASSNNHWNNEGPANLFDGNVETKFAGQMGLTDINDSSKWMSLSFRLPDGSAPAVGYMFTTANDATSFPNRNPTDWVVYGSMDGTDWVELDSRSSVDPPSANYANYADTHWAIQGYYTTLSVSGTANAAATMNLNGGTITGCSAVQGGGAVYVESAQSTSTVMSAGSVVSATVNVSGNPIVADNTVQGGSTLNNIQPTAENQVKLAGTFGGSVGVNWPKTGDVDGVQFGVVTSGNAADGFFYDGDPETYQGEIDGATLVWGLKPTQPVCRIGDTTYTSLKEAVEAANSGDTIVLLRDIDQRSNVTIDKNVTIDGAGFKIARGSANGALTVSANVTMRNLSIDGAHVPAMGPMVTVTNTGSLALPDAVSVTHCANGGISASGPISVAGSTWITDNDGGSLSLANGTLLSVSGELTGTIGVAFPASVSDGDQFGVVGGYAVTASDVRHFVCESDSTFHPTIDGSALKWTNKTSKYPDNDKTVDDILDDTDEDPITVIEITTSTGDGGDIVIPAGRDVVIDLKGNTLTKNIVANGNVTIIDSSLDKTGKLVGTLTENDGGNLTIEAGTFTQRPDDEWLAPNRIIVDNGDDTYTVVAITGSSTVTGCTLDTRRGVRLVENPVEDVLPLTYASSNWVFRASTNQNLRSYVAIVDALPTPESDFANAKWHDGMENEVGTGPVGQGDKSYDYPTMGNSNIVEVAQQEMQYFGPNESEVVWLEWRSGLVQAVLTNETGYLRAWYKFPEPDSNIVPILPGDPEKVQYPGYPDPDDMNTPGDEDYPGYSITNDFEHPLIVVPDPINPIVPDPSDPEHKTITNYVAQTPITATPAETEYEMLIRVVGPGTLTWNDLIIDGSEEQDSWMSIRIDDGPSIEVHRGGMDDWDGQKVVYGGDTDTVHTVRIKFKGNSSGDTVNQANGYIDNVVWDPYIPVVYEQVLDDESLPYIFENLGTEPTWENAGETHYYKNGSETYEIQSTVSTVDENGRQLTSQTTNSVSETATGTEDYWYAIKDPGASNVVGNVIAQTAPTLGTNEVAVMHVTGIDGPSKFYWDMKIEEEGDPETPAKLEVVITKTYTDPDTHETTVTVKTNTYTVAEINEWSHGYKPLGGEIGCEYDVDFIFTNNSDGSAVCKIDDIGWKRPDINIAPEMHDENDGLQPPNGSSYGADDKMRPDPNSPDNVNFKDDPYHPGYTLNNESLNPWEVVPDPKTGDKASDPGKENDDVAQSPDSLESGESTKITVTVEGDGELKWKSFIDDGDGESDVPGTFIVIVDGKTNQVYSCESNWTDHVVHVLDDGVDNATHVIEIIYVQETSDNPDSTGFVDNFRFEKSITNEQMQETLVETDPPSHTVEEERTQVTCTNEVNSGWMPYYDDEHNIVGVRSADGTEGTADGTKDPDDKEDLDSTFYVHVVGTGEIKVDRISFPVEEDPFNTDDGVFTIKVDDVVYQYPPLSDDMPSYSIVTNNGIVTISNLVITVSGDSDLPHDVTFNYHRYAYDITTNTEAIVQRITWKTYGEDDKGGSSWLEGKALWIIDHEDPGDGWVYLAFEPELKVVDELVKWVQRSDEHNMIKVKYGKTLRTMNSCPPVVAHLSDKPGHEVTPVKVWIKVELKDMNKVTVVEPVGYWRIFIDGPAIHLTDADEADENVDSSPKLQAAEPLDPNSPAQESDIINTNGAISVNTFGILKIERATTNSMIAVPWTWYSKLQRNAEDIPVKKLVKTTNLEEGDFLYAPIDNDHYAAWVVVSNEVEGADGKVTTHAEWSAVQIVNVDSNKFGRMTFKSDDDGNTTDYSKSTRIARGNGLWLYRQRPLDGDKIRPFWVYGQSVTTEVTTVVSAPTGSETVHSTMIGNPYAVDIVLNSLDFQGTIDTNDRIKIHTEEGINRDLIYVKGKGWREFVTRIVDGVKKSGYTYQTVIPAGMAFWYDRRGTTDLKIRWPLPDAAQ